VDELQSIAVEVGNVAGLLAGGEVRTLGWLAVVGPACLDRSSVCVIHSLVTVTDNAEVQACLTELALPEADARSDPLPRACRRGRDPRSSLTSR
jgi:hypothetical protein